MSGVQLHDKQSVDNLTREFLTESIEGLDRMEQCLTGLEINPEDGSLIAEIFRCVHTIKGTTGFLGFSRLEKLAHAGEHLLSALRDKRILANEAVISGLLQLADNLRGIVLLIGESGTEGEQTVDEDGVTKKLLLSLLPEPLPQQEADDNQGAGPSLTPNPTPSISAKRPVVPHQIATPEKTLRINVEVLSRMMNLVGDLVLTRNQLLQSQVDAENFPVLARRLDSITADLRETVMQARMQPVGILFNKFPRMVRDLARTCGKNVRIDFSGQETGLDKSLLEAIKDPLTHAVRNCVDHGIESAGTRLMAGKTSEGLITLRARHQSGSVIIEVEDDGGGISLKRLAEKAVERGLIAEETAAAMSDREVLDLVFLPGFSTATSVTTVSGRGVGMDVVRSNIEAVGGSVELESHVGRGTMLRLRVPLTLAIVPALVVQSGGENFCLPQGSLAELVYVPQREIMQSIEYIGDARLYRLRDTLLPVIWLDTLLSLDGSQSYRQQHGFYLAVLETDGCQYGLVIDDLLAPEEIVVKPLSAVLRGIGLFSGATVLGNGSLALILDVAAIAARARIRAVLDDQITLNDVREVAANEPSFVVFEDAADESVSQRKALPLSSVERIESVPVHKIEFVDSRPFLQYRGMLLVLEDPSNLLPALTISSGNSMATILICCRPKTNVGPEAMQEGRVGIVVHRVIDVTKGLLLKENTDIFEGRLALVKNRITIVHTDFTPTMELAEVA